MRTDVYKYILSLDQGTSSSRALIFNNSGVLISSEQKELKSINPNNDWIEQDPIEIFNSQIKVAKKALDKAGITKKDILAIGITNQRETTVIWERKTGIPVYNAIVWQDRRTAKYCSELRNSKNENLVRKKTGLVIDPYFSATKIRWILDHIKQGQKKAEAGELVFGTIDTWLLWKLTGGKVHLTDITNASRTLIFDINKSKWDKKLLELFSIPENILPNVQASSSYFGEAVGDFSGIPITGIAGDQQAALFGQCCNQVGMVKNTYGTGCFLLMNVGDKFVKSKNNLLTTLTAESTSKLNYAIEGSVFIAGAAIKWLRDNLGIISSTSEIKNILEKVKNNGGVYLVPAFSGLGAPHWEPNAKGVFSGLTLTSTKEHFVRAAVESMAYQTYDVLKAMEADSNEKVKQLRVDGGAATNDFLLQFQADILDVPVLRTNNIETTALGAAYLAGLEVKYWKNEKSLEALWKIDKVFEPKMKAFERENLLAAWKNAVSQCLIKSK
jgi:glycerol kinase